MTDVPILAYFVALLEQTARPGWDELAKLGGATVLVAVAVFGFMARVAGKR
jgi:hypothetical protein